MDQKLLPVAAGSSFRFREIQPGVSPASATVNFYECISQVPDHGDPINVVMHSEVLRSQKCGLIC